MNFTEIAQNFLMQSLSSACRDHMILPDDQVLLTVKGISSPQKVRLISVNFTMVDH
jgi:hypothetical protein